MSFLPPSVVLPVPLTTKSHFSPIPKVVNAQNQQDPIILGVDEAGRGPVIGPMVYGLAYTRKSQDRVLRKFGFDDSKKLTPEKRTELMQGICGAEPELLSSIGWATTSITARDISAGMLRPKGSTYNLNSQAHDVTMALIQGILDRGVCVEEVYIDTVGPPAVYQKKLQGRFPGLKITVTKKADSLFPIVSAASIVAKVTRDSSIEQSRLCRSIPTVWGSGYPSDPRTSKWLNGNVHPLYGWDLNVRYSWQTAKDAIKRNNGIEMTWEDDLEEVDDDYGDISHLMSSNNFSSSSISNFDSVRCDWFLSGI
ncbi:hypothetical protein HII13_004044 [Brettanomyces bruxellensis]|nr:hypothetical protein HII13_004044 [Brettanomyces bruxellensis]